VSIFVWLLPLDLSGMGGPPSSYATAGIALRVLGELKPHHHDKVETPSVKVLISPVKFPHFLVFFFTNYKLKFINSLPILCCCFTNSLLKVYVTEE
jgi:hypothetical protein